MKTLSTAVICSRSEKDIRPTYQHSLSVVGTGLTQMGLLKSAVLRCSTMYRQHGHTQKLSI